MTAGPLVSCIVPTANRAAYIPGLLQCFFAQSYPYKELIIFDHGSDRTATLLPDDPQIYYFQRPGSFTVGELRNLCNGVAHGEVICHFDSDDYSAPDRIAHQLSLLGTTGILTGYSSLYFYDERDGQAYEWSWYSQKIILGTSMCYRRSWWQTHPFAHKHVGEDYRFFKTALKAAPHRVSRVPGSGMMVARIHDQQTSKKNLTSGQYRRINRSELPVGFLVSLACAL